MSNSVSDAFRVVERSFANHVSRNPMSVSYLGEILNFQMPSKLLVCLVSESCGRRIPRAGSTACRRKRSHGPRKQRQKKLRLPGGSSLGILKKSASADQNHAK